MKKQFKVRYRDNVHVYIPEIFFQLDTAVTEMLLDELS